MRRLFVDLLGLALLTGPVALHLLPVGSGLLVLISVPIVVGFMRGFVECHFLTKIPLSIAGAEWAFVVLVSGIILCIPNSKSDPHDNFMTVFGAFFIIFIIPSVVLSTVSFIFGRLFAGRRRSAGGL
jgi:hypothetical protein